MLVSDTHQVPLAADAYDRRPFQAPLPRADILIHAGDLSNHGSVAGLAVTYRWLRQADAELKLVIAGNHDVGLDEAKLLGWRRDRAPVSNAGRSKMSLEQEREVHAELKTAREMWTGEEARAAGIRYLEEGTYEFELRNGARFTVHPTQVLGGRKRR